MSHAPAALAPRGAHLVGSVPLASAEEVFRTVADALGDRLRRIPDGETGERFLFAGWQVKSFENHPSFESVPGRRLMEVVTPHRLRAGIDPNTVAFGNLGFAAAALDAYETFRRLKAEQVIPPATRYQVSLPTPVNCLAMVLDKRDIPSIEAAYEAALLRELDAITSAIPHSELAVQWDCPWEVRVWDGHLPRFLVQPWFTDVRADVLARLVRLGDRVASGVELGYHLCHGDYEHTGNLVFRLRGEPRNETVRRLLTRAMRELMVRVAGPPREARTVVEMANALVEGVSRSVNFIHLPAPRSADRRYFAPLERLRLPSGTELYLGLVHLTDGRSGTLRRIAATRGLTREFGVSTECGWGRRDAVTIPALMALHKQVSLPLGQSAWMP